MNSFTIPSNTRRCYTEYLLRPGTSIIRPQALERMDAPQHQLHSTFALDQLTELAERVQASEFVVLMTPIFGLDIPTHTYVKLHNALREGTIKNPEYQVVSEGHYPADYDNQDRTIRIHDTALEYVVKNPHASWELLAVLLHEFGHHLDNVLRRDLADKHPDDIARLDKDAPWEEGARYALHMSLLGPFDLADVHIARYLSDDGLECYIQVNYTEAMHSISRMPIGGRSSLEQNGDRERFEAGAGDKKKSTHRTIEEVLESVAFSRNEIEAIYFGNWLRDYSQLLDPKIVRATSMPKNFPDVLSREALTQIVDVLAIREFPALMKIDRDGFKVTPERLGVYRPSEHIDNPKVVKPQPADPQSRDADFEPWTLPDNPLLQVDFETSKKRYIQRSVDVMNSELEKTLQEGPSSTDGLRSFGAALHTLEDFFAHSNFVELSLIKIGYEEVLPWTSKADCKWGLPLVTGMFGASDVVASLAAPLGEILFSVKDTTFEPTQTGFRSEKDQVIQILLSEHPNENLAAAFEAYLHARDTWAEWPISEWVEKLQWQLGTPVQIFSNAFNTFMQEVLTLLGNSIDDTQTLFDENPNTSGSTDPSHSQLAKDHGEHPLHSLAVLLARDAVLRVAQAMLGSWEGKGGDDPMTVASAYFTHPMDSDWQDEIVRQWADNHPDLVRRSTQKSDLDNVQKQLRNGVAQGLNKFKEDGAHFLNSIISTDNNPILELWKLTPVGKIVTGAHDKVFQGPKD